MHFNSKDNYRSISLVQIFMSEACRLLLIAGKNAQLITDLQGLDRTSEDHQFQSPSKAGSLEYKQHRNESRWALNISAKRGSATSLGQSVPVLFHSHSKEVLPCVSTELPVFQFLTIAPCHVAAHYQKESTPTDLTNCGDYIAKQCLVDENLLY